MAVEAHHLHLFPSQLITNREFMNSIENQSNICNTQMGLFGPASVAASSFIPFNNSGAAASESGLTFNDPARSAPRKRPRDSLSFLGEDISSHFHQQQLEIDRLVAHHTEKVRAELLDRRRRILAAVEYGVSKRLKAKEEEIDRISKLNWVLEERIKSLCFENQVWRELAQTNEAAANVLRSNLEQVLVAQQQVKNKDEHNNKYPMEDAESCCDNNREDDDEEIAQRKRACRNCYEYEPSVLLLPCRHLCLCATCGPVVDACPICKCSKTGSVHVNLS